MWEWHKTFQTHIFTFAFYRSCSEIRRGECAPTKWEATKKEECVRPRKVKKSWFRFDSEKHDVTMINMCRCVKSLQIKNGCQI